MQKIDVEQIMDEIRAEIRENGYKEADLKFQDIPIPAMPSVDNGILNSVGLLKVIFRKLPFGIYGKLKTLLGR